ncbi:MAG: hypothetical protein ACRDSL_16720 [Pseudonocardiaceae bacterium]
MRASLELRTLTGSNADPTDELLMLCVLEWFLYRVSLSLKQ